MKKLQLFLVLASVTTLITNCKKKELPQDIEENSPQFSFTGTVNGSQIDIKAGIDGYYMYSDFSQDPNGVYQFTGNLKRTDCNICPNSISFEINDHRKSTLNGISGADSAFTFKYYPVMSGNPLPMLHTAQFYPLFNNVAINHSWNFGDGKTSALQYPTHTFKGAGEYNVCLTVQDTAYCSNSICNVQKIGNMGADCITSINANSTSTQAAVFTHSTIGLPPYNFLWNFGDGGTSNSAIPSHIYTTQGRYPVSLRVIDSRNDTAYANLNYITSNGTICTTNYLMTSISGVPNPFGLSNIVINWTDDSGATYTSNDFAQPPSSYFKVVKAENYHDNENGQKTKKLTVKFSCVVYNSFNSLLIENAQAVIVVAYK